MPFFQKIRRDLPTFDGHLGQALCHFKCDIIEVEAELPATDTLLWSSLVQTQHLIEVTIFSGVGEPTVSTHGHYDIEKKKFTWHTSGGMTDTMYFQAYATSDVVMKINHSAINVMHVRTVPTTLGEVYFNIETDIIPAIITGRPVSYEVIGTNSIMGQIVCCFQMMSADRIELTELIRNKVKVRERASNSLAIELASAFDDSRDIDLALIRKSLCEEGADIHVASRRRFQVGDTVTLGKGDRIGHVVAVNGDCIEVQFDSHGLSIGCFAKDVRHTESVVWDVVRNEGAHSDNIQECLEIFEALGVHMDAHMVAIACKTPRTDRSGL